VPFDPRLWPLLKNSWVISRKGSRRQEGLSGPPQSQPSPPETWSEAGPSETLFSSAHGLVSSLTWKSYHSNMSTDPMGFPEVSEHFFVHQPQVKSHQRPNILAVPASELKRQPLQLVLTPRDLCLGFVALASWAVKTSDLHSPDAWKIVLLANFGTLSAIRCFRRQVVMESYHGS
ncbi:hypothetical protein E2320_006269, partial [Naja naja]